MVFRYFNSSYGDENLDENLDKNHSLKIWASYSLARRCQLYSSATVGKNNNKLPVSHSEGLNGLLRKDQILVRTDASSFQHKLLRVCMGRRKKIQRMVKG